MERISCIHRLAAILAALLIAVQAPAATSAVPANAATAARQAGKATLGRVMGGPDGPTVARVLAGRRDVTGMTGRERGGA